MGIEFGGLRLCMPEGVYAPSEDTYLLEDAIDYVGQRSLDMGTGSGYIALKLAKRCKNVLGADIDPVAIRAAMQNAEKNGIDNAKFVESDLFSSISGKFDTITFNTPYIEEVDRVDGDNVWSSGPCGNRVVDRFIEGLLSHMREGSCAYILVSSGNRPKDMIERLSALGLEASIKASRRLFFESLHVIKASL